MKSKKNKLNKKELKKWASNMLIFSAPLLILFLESVRVGVPLHQAMYLVYGALINALIDLLKKYVAGK